jgi:hypothetical protein
MKFIATFCCSCLDRHSPCHRPAAQQPDPPHPEPHGTARTAAPSRPAKSAHQKAAGENAATRPTSQSASKYSHQLPATQKLEGQQKRLSNPREILPVPLSQLQPTHKQLHRPRRQNGHLPLNQALPARAFLPKNAALAQKAWVLPRTHAFSASANRKRKNGPQSDPNGD